MTLTIRQQFYLNRFKEHISHAKTLCAGKDFVQAGEKVWGALSALINSRYILEAKGKNEKLRNFVALFSNYQRTNPNLYPEMRKLGFRRAEEVFEATWGLHLNFYGGMCLTDQQLSDRIPFLIYVIENL